jgi:hypothetical protein
MMAGMDEPVDAVLVTADVVGTALIVAAGVLGAVSGSLAKWFVVPVSGLTGAIGLVLFAVSYFRAVGRSREHEISVSQLYGVAGEVAPPAVKRRLQWSLWAQVIVAIVVMVVGFSRTKPNQFNWAACIIAAPLYGLGINGLWVATHGSFGPRILIARPTRGRRTMPNVTDSRTESRDSAPSMEQNDIHG